MNKKEKMVVASIVIIAVVVASIPVMMHYNIGPFRIQQYGLVITGDAYNDGTYSGLTGFMILTYAGGAHHVACMFEWGATTDYGDVVTAEVWYPGDPLVLNFSVFVYHLNEGSRYHYRAFTVGLTEAGGELWRINGGDRTFVAGNDAPFAFPDGPYTGSVGYPVHFDGSASYDTDGTIVRYDWDYGDGTYGEDVGPNPTHTYNLEYTYDVILYVTDDDGDVKPGTTYAIITEVNGPVPPIADADGPYSGDIGESIIFDAGGSYDPDGTIVGYRWDWTNDGVWDTEWLGSPTASHSYSSGGIYVVKLEVKDNEGATDIDMTTATIGAGIPLVKTLSATAVGSNSAVLMGYLQDLGDADSCEVWFVYDVEFHDSWSQYLLDTDPITRSSTGLFEVEITGLSSGTEYHFRAIASSDAGTVQGDDEVFETSSFPWLWIGVGAVAIVGIAGIWYWKKRKSV